MKINGGICIMLYLCVLAASCSCFQKHIHALTTKVNDFFGKKLFKNDNTSPVWDLKQDGQDVASQCTDTDEKYHLFGINWRSINSKITSNWWIIAVSSLLSIIIFWQIQQYNMRRRLHDWKKLLIKKKKPYIHSRRLTLPDLTLARHARRESLAEATQKLTNNSRKLSQCNILQFRNTRTNLNERNDDSTGDIKRVRIMRRRH